MAMTSDSEVSKLNLLDVSGTADCESEGEESKCNRQAGIPSALAAGGCRLRRNRVVVITSLSLLVASTVIFLSRMRSSTGVEAQKPTSPSSPRMGPQPKLPEIEELFSLARGFHPDLDERIAALGAKHSIPNLFLNETAAMMDDPEQVLRKLKTSLEPKMSTMRSLQITSCFADSWQLVLGIGSIITNIKAASQACDEPYPDTLNKRNVCASMVTLNLALWAYMGTYICNMWSSCPGVFSKNATCALGPVGILSSSFTLANAGATMAGNCKQGITTPSPPRDPKDRKIFNREREERKELAAVQAFGGGRRLERRGAAPNAEHGASAGGAVGEFLKKATKTAEAMKSKAIEKKQAKEAAAAADETNQTALEKIAEVHEAIKEHHTEQIDKQWAIATCVFDTQKVAARLLQAVTFMGIAAFDCKEDVFIKKGHSAKDKCVIDIGIIVASLAIAANMISISMINCPHDLAYKPDNLCAAGILNVVSASGYVAVAFAGIHDACRGIDPDGI